MDVAVEDNSQDRKGEHEVEDRQDPSRGDPHRMDDLESLKRENDRLRQQNDRLNEKLLTTNNYAEELRQQVSRLSFEISSMKENTGHEMASQTCDADFREAAFRWHYGEAACNEQQNKEPDDKDAGKSFGVSVVEEVVKAAEEESHKQFLEGMVLEKVSGLYYDYKTGLYYDAERRLYYDGSSGSYYRYNHDTREYEIHSTVSLERNRDRDSRKTKKNRKKDKQISQDKCPKTTSEKKGNDVEDGELSESSVENDNDSVESDHSEAESDVNRMEVEEDLEKDDRIPPSMRIVVLESESVRVGSLFLITYMGGKIGRETSCHVQIEDEGISRTHAEISYENRKFFITDLNSKNGTIVNKTVISDRTEIGHGSRLQIAKTVLQCHVHPGHETCLDCEPGVTLRNSVSNEVDVGISSEKERRQVMKQLKKKYGLHGKDEYVRQEDSSTTFKDRAYKRRKEVGSDNPFEKTDTAHVDKSIATTNKGFKMLSKMGWKAGEGLGKDSGGRVEPIKVEVRAERAGLGNKEVSYPPPDNVNPQKSAYKAEVLRKTQERYQRQQDQSNQSEEDKE